MGTNRYDPADESPELAAVMYALWDGSKQVGEIAEEIESAPSTTSIKLQALKRDGYAHKDKWEYELDKDKIYDQFTSYIDEELHHSRNSYMNQLLDRVVDDLFAHPDIRAHLMGFIKTELRFEEGRGLADLIQKYRDNEIVRLNYIYMLSATPQERIPEDMQEFWDYLTVLQAFMNRAAWTENSHTDALTDQLFRHEEEKMETLDDRWSDLNERARTIIHALVSEDDIEDAREYLLEHLRPDDRNLLKALIEADGRIERDRLRERNENMLEKGGRGTGQPAISTGSPPLEHAGIITMDDGVIELAVPAETIEPYLDTDT